MRTRTRVKDCAKGWGTLGLTPRSRIWRPRHNDQCPGFSWPIGTDWEKFKNTGMFANLGASAAAAAGPTQYNGLSNPEVVGPMDRTLPRRSRRGQCQRKRPLTWNLADAAFRLSRGRPDSGAGGFYLDAVRRRFVVTPFRAHFISATFQHIFPRILILPARRASYFLSSLTFHRKR